MRDDLAKEYPIFLRIEELIGSLIPIQSWH